MILSPARFHEDVSGAEEQEDNKAAARTAAMAELLKDLLMIQIFMPKVNDFTSSDKEAGGNI
jgi:hypothetical protein